VPTSVAIDLDLPESEITETCASVSEPGRSGAASAGRTTRGAVSGLIRSAVIRDTRGLPLDPRPPAYVNAEIFNEEDAR